jgi:hypothetical protein
VVRENHLMNKELFEAVHADVLMHPSLIVANRIRMLLGTPLLTEFVHYARFEDDAWACELIGAHRGPGARAGAGRLAGEHRRRGRLRPLQLRTEGPLPTIGDLLRDPRDRGQHLPAIVLMRRRENAAPCCRTERAAAGGLTACWSAGGMGRSRACSGRCRTSMRSTMWCLGCHSKPAPG